MRQPMDGNDATTRRSTISRVPKRRAIFLTITVLVGCAMIVTMRSNLQAQLKKSENPQESTISDDDISVNTQDRQTASEKLKRFQSLPKRKKGFVMLTNTQTGKRIQGQAMHLWNNKRSITPSDLENSSSKQLHAKREGNKNDFIVKKSNEMMDDYAGINDDAIRNEEHTRSDIISQKSDVHVTRQPHIFPNTIDVKRSRSHVLPGILPSVKLLDKAVTSADELPRIFRHDPLKWTDKGKIPVCVLSRTRRQDSLMRSQVLALFGTNRFAYRMVRAQDCQHQGTCKNVKQATLPCDYNVMPTVRHLERIKCCAHERYDRVLSRGLEIWDVVFSTGDEFCQTSASLTTAQAQFRTYFSSTIGTATEARTSLEIYPPSTYMPLGPRAEFERVPASEVIIATGRQYLFNFMGSITSISRHSLVDQLHVLQARFAADASFVHVISKWGKKLIKENGYLSPAEYRAVLIESTFTLCPQGHNPESFRIYEACESGSIPVLLLDESYYSHDCNDSFKELIDSHAPFVFLNSWSELDEVLNKMLAEPAQVRRLQASVMEWFRAFMASKSQAFEGELTRRFLARIGATSLDEFAKQHYGISYTTATDAQYDAVW